MKNIFILSGLILSFNFCGFSQSNHLEKKLEKATELVNKNKINDADSDLENVLKDNPEYGDGWALLAKIRYKEYKDSKLSDNILGGNLVVTTTDSKGKKIGNDSLSNALMDLLNNIKPSKKAFSKYTYTMRKALLTSENANYCSVMLRNFYIDEAVDTAVCKKALKYY